MKKQRLPKGWTERQIKALADHHDSLSEEEQTAEIEAGLAKNGQTLMVVPTKLVPDIERLIRDKASA